MPKIQNWTDVGDNEWENDETHDSAHIMEDTTRGQFGEETHYYPALNGEPIRGDWAFTSRREARDRLRDWMKQNPYAGQKTVWVDEFDSISDAEAELRRRFERFEESDESFHFECVVHDDEGFEAVVSVDWSVESFDEDFAYTANVLAWKEEQPVDDKEKVKESEAVITAENIIKRGAEGLSYYSEKHPKPRIHAEYEDRGDSYTGFLDIQWRSMREVR